MPKLKAAWASGLSTPELRFQDQHTLVGIAGQYLKFTPCSSLSSKESLVLYPGEKSSKLRHGILVLATCPKAKLFAYSEKALKPVITVCTFPGMEEVAILGSERDKVLRYLAFAFSRSGSLLASLSEQPEPELTIWRVDQRDILISAHVSASFHNLAFNPSNDNLLYT